MCVCVCVCVSVFVDFMNMCGMFCQLLHSLSLSTARAVEIFLQALLTRGADYAGTRNAKTLTVGHL